MGILIFVIEVEKDKKGGRKITIVKCENITKTWCEESDVIDIWRIKNFDKNEFTWKRLNPFPIFSRLNFFPISLGLFGKTDKVEIISRFKSDHSFVGISLTLWKMLEEKVIGNLIAVY